MNSVPPTADTVLHEPTAVGAQAARNRALRRRHALAVDSTLLRYGIPVLATAGVAGARTLLAAGLGHQAPLLAFTLAVMVSAYYGGLGPGSVAILLGAGVGAYFFMEPEFGWHPLAIPDYTHLALFVVVGILITLLSHAMRQARNSAAADATALAINENRLREVVAELARSNAELDYFATIVSHDLRAPMVTIAGYVHLLQRQNDAGISGEQLEAVENIRDGVRQMDGLIRTLLAYSRVGRAKLTPRICHAQAVVDGVLKTLAPEIHASGAIVTCDALPETRADEVLLAQALQNLIENAIKYRGQGRPQIHISARREAASVIFSVRDNGIGITVEHRDRIFEMGGRVYQDETRYRGSGIGLATCKRIVERHGGRIWVESEPGKGSIFFFSLPA